MNRAVGNDVSSYSPTNDSLVIDANLDDEKLGTFKKLTQEIDVETIKELKQTLRFFKANPNLKAHSKAFSADFITLLSNFTESDYDNAIDYLETLKQNTLYKQEYASSFVRKFSHLTEIALGTHISSNDSWYNDNSPELLQENVPSGFWGDLQEFWENPVLEATTHAQLDKNKADLKEIEKIEEDFANFRKKAEQEMITQFERDNQKITELYRKINELSSLSQEDPNSQQSKLNNIVDTDYNTNNTEEESAVNLTETVILELSDILKKWLIYSNEKNEEKVLWELKELITSEIWRLNNYQELHAFKRALNKEVAKLQWGTFFLVQDTIEEIEDGKITINQAKKIEELDELELNNEGVKAEVVHAIANTSDLEEVKVSEDTSSTIDQETPNSKQLTDENNSLFKKISGWLGRTLKTITANFTRNNDQAENSKVEPTIETPYEEETVEIPFKKENNSETTHASQEVENIESDWSTFHETIKWQKVLFKKIYGKNSNNSTEVIHGAEFEIFIWVRTSLKYKKDTYLILEPINSDKVYKEVKIEKSESLTSAIFRAYYENENDNESLTKNIELAPNEFVATWNQTVIAKVDDRFNKNYVHFQELNHWNTKYNIYIEDSLNNQWKLGWNVIICDTIGNIVWNMTMNTSPSITSKKFREKILKTTNTLLWEIPDPSICTKLDDITYSLKKTKFWKIGIKNTIIISDAQAYNRRTVKVSTDTQSLEDLNNKQLRALAEKLNNT